MATRERIETELSEFADGGVLELVVTAPISPRCPTSGWWTCRVGTPTSTPWPSTFTPCPGAYVAWSSAARPAAETSRRPSVPQDTEQTGLHLSFISKTEQKISRRGSRRKGGRLRSRTGP